MKMCLKINFLIFFLGCLLFQSCQKEAYNPKHDQAIAVYSILDPDQAIELEIWRTLAIGSESIESRVNHISIHEDDNLVFMDTSDFTTITTNIIPKIGSEYTIEVSDEKDGNLIFRSRPVLVFERPEISSYTANDSVGLAGPNTSQTLHQIVMQIEISTNNSPYFGYEMFVDSLPFKDKRPINVTGGWFRNSGINCLEIAETPYFDRNLRIINLTCFEEEHSLTLESGNYRPTDVKTIDFTLCNFDTHTMDFSRWIFQNLFFNTDFPITQIFSTKDNFKSDASYDFVLNRTCKDFNIEFN